jgi:predicted phage-related endonuclease
MTDPRLLSWSLIVYSQIASTLSNVLSRDIKHVKLDEQGRIDSLVQAGVSDYFAKFITRLELMASNDFEKATGDVVQRLTGHPPKSFKEFAEENKSVWNA